LNQSDLVRLLRECADALYYVFECGDSRVFHNGRYEELALRCDDMKKQLESKNSLWDQLWQESVKKSFETLKKLKEVKAD